MIAGTARKLDLAGLNPDARRPSFSCPKLVAVGSNDCAHPVLKTDIIITNIVATRKLFISNLTSKQKNK
jgi:hypothetical protein